MKLGLGSYTFRWSIGHKGRVPENPMRAVELIEIADHHDLDVVQFADNLPLHQLGNDELDELAQQAKARGIEIEVGIQAWNEGMVRDYLAIAQRLNASIVRIALDGEDAVVPLPELAASLSGVLPKVRAAGVRLAIENHFDFPSDRMAALLELVDDDGLGVCLDVANSICAGEWPMETVKVLAPHSINLHLKDYEIIPDPYGVGFRIEGTPLGAGRTDIRAVLDALEWRNMSVILEHWLPFPGDFETASKMEKDWLSQSIMEARKFLPKQSRD